MSYEFLIAFRYLRARRKQAFISLITFLSVAGVSLGVMALVVVIAVMAGAESDFRDRILGVEPHVWTMRHGGVIENADAAVQAIASIPGVTASTPFVISQAMITSGSGSAGVMLRGVDPDTAQPVFRQMTTQNEVISALSIPDESSSHTGGIVLGKALAGNLGVYSGDTVYIMSMRGMITPMGILPRMTPMQVTGTFETGMYEYDSSLAYLHIRTARKLLRLGNGTSRIGTWIRDVYSADRISAEIKKTLGFPYFSSDWMTLNQNLFSALKLEKTAMFIILTLIILVAAFNIASMLIMTVMEKTRDIAILKAMGATDRSIRRIFMITGMMIGGLGTLIGSIGGVILCILLQRYQFVELPAAYPFTTLPVKLAAGDVVTIVAAALLICLASAVYPARQAARLNPVEGIRYGG